MKKLVGQGAGAKSIEVTDDNIKTFERVARKYNVDFKSLLQGKKILVKGLKGNYDAYLIPQSIEEFSYMKDGRNIKGFQYKFKMEFPQRKD